MRGNEVRKRLSIFAITMCMILASGCSSGGNLGEGSPGTDTAEVTDTDSTDNSASVTETSAAEENDSDPAVNIESSGSGFSADFTDNKGKKPFYERVCGRYACRMDEELYYIMDIESFGGNMYAYAGEAYGDEGELDLSAYSFWAMEIFPENEEDVFSTDLNECRVGILSFSIMSNLSKYQSAPDMGTMRITEDGILFEGFGGGSVFSEMGEGLLLRPDERVEHAFPYLIHDPNADHPELEGYWKQKTDDDPIFLEFTDDGNVSIYNKSPEREVMFARGSYKADEEEFACQYNLLGSGGSPYVNYADWDVSGGVLKLEIEDGPDLFLSNYESGDILVFEKIDVSQVPVITMSDVRAAGYDENYNYDMYAAYEENRIYDPFYGVWVYASKDEADAEAFKDKLLAEGFEAEVVYSQDWDGITSVDYYCVTAGRCETEFSAEGLLVNVKSAGYNDAYVKYSGKYIG